MAKRLPAKRRTKRSGKVRVEYRDARGRFTKRRPKIIVVTRPGGKPQRFKNLQDAADYLQPLPPGQPKEFGRSGREARSLIDLFRNRRMLHRYEKHNATFQDLQAKRGDRYVMLPKLRKGRTYTVRVFWRGHWTTTTGVWDTKYRAGSADIWHRIVSTMGTWTDAERARMFNKPSGDASAQQFGIRPGTSFRERQKLLDKRGIPKTHLIVEVYE